MCLNVQQFDLVEDLSPHGYTPKLRQAIFTFFNTHLKNDSKLVTDDVTDFVEPAENLLVFGGKLPSDDTMMKMDEQLVKQAEIPLPADVAEWELHQKNALAKLRQTTFRNVPQDATPRLRDKLADGGTKEDVNGTRVFETADGLTLAVKTRHPRAESGPVSMVIFPIQPEATSTFTGGGASRPALSPDLASAGVEVRNTGATSVGPGYLWTLRRVYPLLGHTLPERQVADLLAGAALMRQEPLTGSTAVYGQGETAVLAIYAAILDPQIREVILAAPPESHTASSTAELLGILRTGDLPQNLALLYPRPITFVGSIPPAYEWTKKVYEKLGASGRIRVIHQIKEWHPQKT